MKIGSRSPVLWSGVLLVLAVAQTAFGAEYFVSVRGSHDADGKTWATAFSTVQQGLDALSAGDTLTLGPGEYGESAHREGLGNEQVDTVIRAAVSGTAVLRGDVPAPAFEKLPGYRFIYGASVTQPVQAVIEGDSLSIMESKPSLVELEFNPGTFYYDAPAGRLYISTTDLQPPTAHQYTLSVRADSGLHLVKPTRVIIDGLAATGYYRSQIVGTQFADNQAWGISLSQPVNCTVRHAVTYLNAGGLCMDRGKGATIEYCTGYANYSSFNTGNANIGRFRSEGGDVIRHCYSYRGGSLGLVVYPLITGKLLLENNIDWGDSPHFKGRGLPELATIERSVGIDGRTPANIHHSIVMPTDGYAMAQHVPANDNIVLKDPKIDIQKEFADPDHMDYRLQATSQFRGKASDGGDLGPYPYQPNIFYVSPQGDDHNDGLSAGRAWKSFDKATTRLKAGDTLYLEAGTYSAIAIGQIKASADGVVRLAARGQSHVILAGRLEVSQAHGVTFERLDFKDEVNIAQSSDITFSNCIFQGKSVALQADGVENLIVEQCLFTGFGAAAVQAAQSPGLFLRGNLWINVSSPAVKVDQLASVKYADYNNYQRAAQAWEVGGSPRALDKIGPGYASYSQAHEAQVKLVKGVPVIVNASTFASGGPLGKDFGPWSEFAPPQLHMAGPFVESTSDTTANITWTASHPSDVQLAWGATPSCENKVTFSGGCWGAYSLTDLKPGVTYYVTIRQVTPHAYDNRLDIDPLKVQAEALSFQTAAGPAPARTLHVATDGDDSHTGLSPQDAWRTISHAASMVQPGDTVLIAGGEYAETVRVRATGVQGRPITFKAAPGQQVTLSGQGRMLSEAFILGAKHYIQLDSLYFRGYGTGAISYPFTRIYKGTLMINQSHHLRVTRCLVDGSGPGYEPPFMVAMDSQDLSITNSVLYGCYNGLLIFNCPNFVLDHNVFFRNLIASLILGNGSDQPARVTNNIFTDNLPVKVHVKLIEATDPLTLTVSNNCFYLRLPPEERLAFQFYTLKDWGKLSVTAYEARIKALGKTQSAQPSLVLDPQFAGFAGMTFPPAKPGALPYNIDAYAAATRPGQPGEHRLDFPDLFATHPQVVQRDMGLQPQVFADFHFNQKPKEKR